MNEKNEFGNIILLKGWDFTREDYINAWKKGNLLTAQIENTNFCNLDCIYCFRGGTPPTEKHRFGDEISREELFNSIKEMSDLRVKTINIIGAGEPLMDKNLEQLLENINSLGITPLVSTNGSLITPSLVKSFQKYNTSVVLKMNSFDSKLQNKLVQRENYAEKRDYGLKLLMDAGFNKKGENYQTKLGINSIVFQDNKKEVLDILRYCRNNNIMPIMATFIPIGRTADKTDQEVSLEEFLEISKQARDMDSKEYGIKYNRLTPYLGGVPCTQCSKSSMYLTITGDIFDCPGQLYSYGNIKNISIKDAFEKLRKEVNNKNLECPPRIESWKKGSFPGL